MLKLFNPCNPSEPILMIRMHKNFQLFATQNPGSGFFKGKREKLSSALIDRFTVKVFEEFPKDELIEIVNHKLQTCFGEASSKWMSELMVNVHETVKDILNDNQFKEKSPYDEITVRELLKLSERMCELKSGTLLNQ